MTANKEVPATAGPRSAPDRAVLLALIEESAGRHHHLCPRQVLGVRMGLVGLHQLGLVQGDYFPRFKNRDKRLLTIVETDGCGADGIAVATDCSIGRRTLRILDFGKVAVTLIDITTGAAVRIRPAGDIRRLALNYAPGAASQWQAYLEAYQVMPDDQLVSINRVRLTRSLAEILSKPNIRVTCMVCGEEIINEREVLAKGQAICRACAGESYYIVEQ